MTIQLKDISKRYGGTQALKGVSLTIEPGKVHALVGENGAGKSTCLGVLGGRVRPDRGQMIMDTEIVTLASPRHASAFGISSIYQELSVIPTLTAVENVFLAQEIKSTRISEDFRAQRNRYAEICSALDVTIPPNAATGALSIGDQQMLEIMRALVRQPKAILLDEPTAALGPRERSTLYKVIRDLREQGVAIVVVSHNLDEVLHLSDDVTVFRDGQISESRNAAQWSRKDLTDAMISHTSVQVSAPKITARRAETVLNVTDLSYGKIRNVSFDLHAGEIVGVAGLVGSGRSTLLRLLSGDATPRQGAMRLANAEVPWPRSVREARRQGICLLSEDRKRSGLIPESSSFDNILLGDLKSVSKFGFVSSRRSGDKILTAAKSVRFAPNRLRHPINSLSGGNQQKALIARAVHFEPLVFLADEPTRGVDVGAKTEISTSLRRMADSGSTLLVVSSEFEELSEICDRVLILWKGSVIQELTGKQITLENLVSGVFGPEKEGLCHVASES
jgi:ABC-type sugar transport system ATPase subunit